MPFPDLSESQRLSSITTSSDPFSKLTLSKNPDTTIYPRYSYIDMRAFYASVEQQDNEYLREQPVMIIHRPVKKARIKGWMKAIAVSYEAKEFGVKTQMSIEEAQERCPRIKIVTARMSRYLEVHEQIVNLIRKNHFSTVEVLSIDEMVCSLHDHARGNDFYKELSAGIRHDIAINIGKYIKCAIGYGPNKYLSKVAAEMDKKHPSKEKPEDCVILTDDYQLELLTLSLTNLPEIGKKRAERLLRNEITTVEELWNTPSDRLRHAWGSVEGRWFYEMLHGNPNAEYPWHKSTRREIVSSSYNIPSEVNLNLPLEGIENIFARILTKALFKLRTYDLVANKITIHIETSAGRLHKRSKEFSSHAHDDFFWITPCMELYRSLPLQSKTVRRISISFEGLLPKDEITSSFLEGQTDDIKAKRERVCKVKDELNRKYGEIMYQASIEKVLDHARPKITFGPPDRRTFLESPKK